jgi:hypothetical protein
MGPMGVVGEDMSVMQNHHLNHNLPHMQAQHLQMQAQQAMLPHQHMSNLREQVLPFSSNHSLHMHGHHAQSQV